MISYLKSILMDGIRGVEGDRSFGGEECANESSLQLRMVMNISVIIYQFWLIHKIQLKPLVLTFFKNKKINTFDYTSPLKTRVSEKLEKNQMYFKSHVTIIEKIVGVIGLASFLLTLISKINSKRLFFMLNPCHTVCVYFN